MGMGLSARQMCAGVRCVPGPDVCRGQMCAGARCVQGSEVCQGCGRGWEWSFWHRMVGRCIGEAQGSFALPVAVSPKGQGRVLGCVPACSGAGWLSTCGKPWLAWQRQLLHGAFASQCSAPSSPMGVSARCRGQRPCQTEPGTSLVWGQNLSTCRTGAARGPAVPQLAATWGRDRRWQGRVSPLPWDCCWWRDGTHCMPVGCPLHARGVLTAVQAA